MRFDLGNLVKQIIVIITLFVPAALNAQVSSNSPVCTGGAINLSVSASGTGFYWTGPNSFTSKSQNPTISPANVNHSGVYTVGVIVAPNDTDFYSATVEVVPTPAAPAMSSPYKACMGQPFILYSNDYNPAFTYTWTGPAYNNTTDSLAINSVNAASGGTYTVVAKDRNCPSPSSSFQIQVKSKPALPNITSQATFCEDGTINLTTSNAGTFSLVWVGPNGFSSGVNAPVINNATSANEGSYGVVFKDVDGCPGDTARKTITMTKAGAAPSISGDTTLCIGDTLALVANPPGTATQYSWTAPPGPGALRTYRINGVSTSDAGMYSVKYYDGKCFSNAGKVNVSINAIPSTPSVSAVSTILCEEQTLELSTDNNPGEAYRWGGPRSYVSSGSTTNRPNLVQADSGYYFVQTVVNGCASDSAKIFISVKPTPKVPALTTNAPVCARLPLTVKSTAYDPGITYTWTSPSGGNFNDSVSLGTSAYTDSGYYYITASINGCSSKADSIHVRIKHRIDNWYLHMPNPICVNYNMFAIVPEYEEAVYSIYGPKSSKIPFSTSIYWEKDSTQFSDAGLYTATAYNTCDTVSVSRTIQVLASPVFTVVGDTGICDYETRELKVSAPGESLTYLWNTFETTESIIIDTNSLYSVVGTNAQGCTTRVEHLVHYLCRPEVYVPKAFTPNGDGVNDKFEINIHNAYGYKLEIFNRDGTMIYQSEDVNAPWDGKYNGHEMKDGMYVFTLKYKTNYHYAIYEELLTGTFFIIK